TFCLGGIAVNHHVSRYIFANRRSHAAEAVGADTAILMHQSEAAQNRPIADAHMSRQRGVIDQNAMIANNAVVTNMHIGHQQIVVTYSGFAAILHSAAMNGDAFTNNVVIAHYQARWLTLVLEIRRVFAQRRKLVNAVMRTNARWPFDNHMGGNHSALTNLYVWANQCPGTYAHIGRDASIGVNYSAWVYHDCFSLNSAAAAARRGGQRTEWWPKQPEHHQPMLCNQISRCRVFLTKHGIPAANDRRARPGA